MLVLVPLAASADEPPLESWPRPEWVAGGGDAFVSYVVFGAFKQPFAVSHSKHRTKGIPDGVQARMVDHAYCAGFTSGPFGDLLEEAGS